jgi:hypothetical protein
MPQDSNFRGPLEKQKHIPNSYLTIEHMFWYNKDMLEQTFYLEMIMG